MYERFLEYIVESKILQPNQRLLVGVSGGPDSLFLLYCLLKYRTRFQWTLAIAHLNHGLRGEIADEEEAFVEAVAQYWQLPCFTEKVDLVALTKVRKKGDEEAGRTARHDFFAKTAHAWQADAVVLGHHADDQVENFILRLLRGSGPEGLLPMREILRTSKDFQIVRPLIKIKHQDIINFLDHEGSIYCQDLSNEENRYLRSKVRSQLLPALEKESPNIRSHISNLQELLQWDQDYLAQVFDDHLVEAATDPFGLTSISCEVLTSWPKAFVSRWLIKQFYSLISEGEPLQFQHISLVMEKLKQQPAFWSASLPADLTVMISGGRLFLLTRSQVKPQPFTLNSVELPNSQQLPYRLTIPGLFCSLLVEKNTGLNQTLGGLFGSKALEKEMLLRTWRAGDTINFNHGITKKVSNYFQERRIPIPWRYRLPFLCEGEQIVMIPNHYIRGEYQPAHIDDVFGIFIENYPS